MLYRWSDQFHVQIDQDSAKCYVYLAKVLFDISNVNRNELGWSSGVRWCKWFTWEKTVLRVVSPTSVTFFTRASAHMGEICAMTKDRPNYKNLVLDPLRRFLHSISSASRYARMVSDR
jgi:hypothetical protein